MLYLILFYLTILLMLLMAIRFNILNAENKIIIAYAIFSAALAVMFALLQCYFLSLVIFIGNLLIITPLIYLYTIFHKRIHQPVPNWRRYILGAMVLTTLVSILYADQISFAKLSLSFTADLPPGELAAWSTPEVQFGVVIFFLFLLASIITILSILRNDL